jgi:PAS domain S-box-containing protein
MLISDTGGAVLYANRQLLAMFGYTREEVIGSTVERLIPEHLRAKHVVDRNQFVAQARNRPMGSGLPLAALHKNGFEFAVQVCLNSAQDEGRAYLLAVIRKSGGFVDGHSSLASIPVSGIPHLPSNESSQSVPGTNHESVDFQSVLSLVALRPQLLVVQRYAAMRHAARMLLEVEGYRVVTASNLAEARSRALNYPSIQLLLTEQELGDGVQGLHVIRAVRQLLDRNIGAVMITDDHLASGSDMLGYGEGVHTVRIPVQAEELLRLLKEMSQA